MRIMVVPCARAMPVIALLVLVQSYQSMAINLANYIKPNACGTNTTMFVCDPTSPTPTCVTTDKYMDCYKNCPNGADEMCSDNYTKCDKCKCVDPTLIKRKCVDYNVPVCNIGNTWACRSGGQCILNSWVWDGVPDCNDGSDEDPAFVNQCLFPGAFYCPNNSECVWAQGSPYTCKCNKGWIYTAATQTCDIDLDARLPGSCSAYPLQIQCGDGKCVSFTKFRDCVVDCNDGADEACYPGFVKCDGCKCVDPQSAKYVCFDYINQKICNSSAVYDIFRCPDGRCLLGAWVMDGEKDCSGGEDENPCYLGLSDCPTTTTATASTAPTTTPTTKPTTTAATTPTTSTTKPTTITTTPTTPTTTPTTTTSTTATSTTKTTPATTTAMTTTTTTRPTTTSTTTPATTTTTTRTTPTTTTTTSTTTTPTTTPTTTTTTTTTRTTPTTTTPTTTTPTTTRATTTSSTTTTTTPTTTPTTTTTTPSTTRTTTTTTPTTTTMRTQQLTANQITIGFVVDDSTAMQNDRSLIASSIKNSSALFSPVEQQRVFNYLLVGYTDASSSVVANKYFYREFVPAVDAWAASPAKPVSGCSSGALNGVQSALSMSTPRCQLFVFVDAASAANRTQSMIDAVVAMVKQCHLNFVLFNSPCLDTAQPNQTFIYQHLADLTVGFVFTVDKSNMQTALSTVYNNLGSSAVNPRIIIDYGYRTPINNSYMTSFCVDAQLTEVTICVTGCNPVASFLRDNRGFGLQAGKDYTLTVNYSEAICATVKNLTSWPKYDQPGPGMWVITINSQCPIRYRIDAAGQTEYNFQWTHSTKDTNAMTLPAPVLGVPEFVIASLVDPKAVVYYPALLHYVTLPGVTPATSSMSASLVTDHQIQAPNGIFYIKVLGFDQNGLMFQRFSRIGYTAMPFLPMRQLQSASCSGQLDCTGNGTCAALSTRLECVNDCPNAMDEACPFGTFKCFCTCLQLGRECIDPSLKKMCSQTDTTLYTCANNTGCIPIKWEGDGETDCLDNSDEDPAVLNECNPVRKLALCDKSATCSNLPQASYYCTCPAGTWGDGLYCLPRTTASPSGVPAPAFALAAPAQSIVAAAPTLTAPAAATLAPSGAGGTAKAGTPQPIANAATAPPALPTAAGPTLPRLPAPPAAAAVASPPMSNGTSNGTAVTSGITNTAAVTPQPSPRGIGNAATTPIVQTASASRTAPNVTSAPRAAGLVQTTAAAVASPPAVAAAPTSNATSAPAAATSRIANPTAVAPQPSAAPNAGTAPPPGAAAAAPTTPRAAAAGATAPNATSAPAAAALVATTTKAVALQPSPAAAPAAGGSGATTVRAQSSPPTAVNATAPPSLVGAGTSNLASEPTGNASAPTLASGPNAMLAAPSAALVAASGPVDPVIKAIYFSTCGVGTFQCTDGKCIQFSQYLDCKADCSDGLDEKCTAGLTQCDGCKCVVPNAVARGCTDTKAKKMCQTGAPGVFTCKDGSGCVYYQWAMDGLKDCQDGSDENPLYWDECLLGSDQCDRTHAVCMDDIAKPYAPTGDPVCECQFGYGSKDNGRTCFALGNAGRRRRRLAMIDPQLIQQLS